MERGLSKAFGNACTPKDHILVYRSQLIQHSDCTWFFSFFITSLKGWTKDCPNK